MIITNGKKKIDRNMAKPNTIIRSIEINRTLDKLLEDESFKDRFEFTYIGNIPKEIKLTVEKQTIIKINGVDKELVSKVAADIKNLKPVEPYKGKGIKFKGEQLRRKAGKTAAK